jgi:predicted aspartyl protease
MRSSYVLDKLLVDTVAAYTILPRSIAEKIGAHLTPYKVELTPADKSKRASDIGMTEIEVEKRRAPIQVAIVDDGIPALGAQALEVLGFEVNPLTRKLEPYKEPGGLALPYDHTLR